MRDRGRMSRPNLEGTGLCRPLGPAGSRGASPVVPSSRNLPRKTYSYGSGLSVKRNQNLGREVTSLAALRESLTKDDNDNNKSIERAAPGSRRRRRNHSNGGSISSEDSDQQQGSQERSLRPSRTNLRKQLSDTHFLDNSFTSCMTSNAGGAFDDQTVMTTATMDASVATWSPAPDRRNMLSKMDSSNTTWTAGGGHHTAGNGRRTGRKSGAPPGLRRTNTGGAAKKSPFICGPDMTSRPKAVKDGDTSTAFGAMAKDLFAKLPGTTMAADVVASGVTGVTQVTGAVASGVTSVGRVTTEAVASGVTTVGHLPGVSHVTDAVTSVGRVTGVSHVTEAVASGVGQVTTDLFGKLPQMRRSASDPLADLNSTCSDDEDAYNKVSLDQPFRAVATTQRQDSIPVDDLDSAFFGPEEDAEDSQTNSRTPKINNHDNPLRKPTLKRNISAPMEVLRSSLLGGKNDKALLEALQSSLVAGEDDDDFGKYDDDGFPAFLPRTKPTRNNSAPMEDFSDFSDVFFTEDPTAPLPDNTKIDSVASQIMPTPAKEDAPRRRPLRRVKSTPKKVLRAAAEAAQEKVHEERIVEAMPKRGLMAAANRARTRVRDETQVVETMPKEGLLAAAERARAKVQEARSIDSTTSLAAKTTLIAAAERAKARVKDSEVIQSTSQTVQDKLVSVGKRAKTRVRAKNEAGGMSASENGVARRTRSHKQHQDLSSTNHSASGITDLVDNSSVGVDNNKGNIQSTLGRTRRARDEARLRNTSKSRSPCRLRRVNSSASVGSLRRVNSSPSVSNMNGSNQQQQQESALNAMRRNRKKSLMDQKQEEQMGSSGSLAGPGAGSKLSTVGASPAHFAQHDQAQEVDDDDDVSPTGVNELQESARSKKGGERSLSPKARAKKGINKIRNLIGSTQKWDRNLQLSNSAEDDQQPKAPNRRTSLFGLFVQPKKAFRQMEGDVESVLDLPDLTAMDGNTSVLLSNNQNDDSTAGDTSSRSEANEGKGKDNLNGITEDSRRRRRRSKSRSRADKLSASSHHKKKATSSHHRVHSENRSKSARRKSSRSTHETRREKDKMSTSEKRRSADRKHAHHKPSEGEEKKKLRRPSGDDKKATKQSETKRRDSEGKRRDRTSTGQKKRSSRSDGSKTQDSSRNSHRRGSSDTRNADAKSKRSSNQSKRDMDTSESEQSIGLTDLDMTDSSHGSFAINSSSMSSSSISGSDRSGKARGRGRGSGSSSSLQGDSGTRTSKSMRESLQLDTVLETYSEDDISEGTPRGRKRMPSRNEQKVERSPSRSSSIQSTAEISDSDDEFAGGRHNGGPDDKFSDMEPHRWGPMRGGQPFHQSGERHSLSITDLRRESFLNGSQGYMERQHVSDGALRHAHRNSGSHLFDPRGHDSFYSLQHQSFGQQDSVSHWDDSFYAGEGNPRRWSHGQYPQSKHPQDMQGPPRGPHPDYHRWQGDGRLGPFSHHGGPSPHGGFYDHGPGLSRGHPHGGYHWPPPWGRMGFDAARRLPNRASGLHPGGYGDAPHQARPGMDQQQGPEADSNDQPTVRARIRRRHSIGSAHDRDAIMQEVTAAMDREHKAQGCCRCERSMAECECVEPIIDISRHTRDIDSSSPEDEVPTDIAPIIPRALEGRLTSSDHVAMTPSLYDTFGISYADPSLIARRMMSRRTEAIDNDLHAGEYNPYVHYGPSRPLYGRPDKWDLNDYSDGYGATGASRLASRNNNHQQHRGRAMGGLDEDDHISDKYGRQGPRRSFASVDDDSIRYPRRFSSPTDGSMSGRTQDDSGRSFAI